MTRFEIQNHRLFNQNISHSDFSRPDDLVQWLCGIQAQDYMNAKWAMGVRMTSMTDEIIEKSLLDKSIIRTWMFRGTLHFISGRDIHWLLRLLAKRILEAAAPRNRQLGLDEKTLQKCMKLLDTALKDGNAHTREEVSDYFKFKGIEIKGNMLSHILHYSALNGQICFGPKRGSEFTFNLLDEAGDKGSLKNREEALGELASRYFMSHGPATLEDFIWWSGLSVKDAKSALEMAKKILISDTFQEKRYWMQDNSETPPKKKMIRLLPAFDSYFISYRDRSIYLDNMDTSKVISSNGIFRPIIVQDGKIVGIWNRSFKKDKLLIQTKFFTPANDSVNKEILKCAEQFAKYLKKDLSHVSINNKIL